MNIANDFRTLQNNINISSQKRESISFRYKRITKQLNKDFRKLDSEISYSFYAGSYGRGTAINTISDLDVVYQLPYAVYAKYNNYTGNKQSALLQAVRNSIKTTYPKTATIADGQIITVSFADNIIFEILPAFINDDNSYTFADANKGGNWKKTNPKPEISAIRHANEVTNGNLIALCKMMRAWKKHWNVPIGGLLLDTLACQFIINWEYRNKSFMYYDFLSQDFFAYLANQNKTQYYWKAPGSSQYVYGEGFQFKAKRCYNLAVEATEFGIDDKIRSARSKWREIYGKYYPE